MGKLVTASLEGNEVKIIHSSTKLDIIHDKWKIIHIEKWDIHHIYKKEVVADREFNAYLDRDRAKEYVVVCDFDEYFHGIILVPALKPKFIKKVIESEIRKATGKTDFTFVHSILGDKVVDNKKMTEIFYYMVTNEAIGDIVERFYDNGKIVRALYPSLFAAALFINSKESQDVNMGVIFAENKRIVFTTKSGTVNFVRDYESMTSDITDFDIQNINMTLTYCMENLRIEPSSVTFLGNPKGVSTLMTESAVPIVPPDMPENIHCDGKVACDYSLACSALNISRTVSILSDKYKDIYLLRRIIEVASLTFIVLSVVYFGLLSYIANDVFQTKHEIESVVSGLSGVEKAYGEYSDRRETLKDIVLLVDFLNRPSIDIQPFLIDLSRIKLQQMRFDRVDVKAEGDTSFLISINGISLEGTYSTFQASFDKLVDGLEKMNNIELKDKTINHMDKTFQVQLHYGK